MIYLLLFSINFEQTTVRRHSKNICFPHDVAVMNPEMTEKEISLALAIYDIFAQSKHFNV